MTDTATRRVTPEEIARQRAFAAEARDMLIARFGERPTAFVHSYGCQQNVADGERICGMLAEMGFGFTDEPESADLILFNTCAVRGHAEDRALGNIGALKGLKQARPATILALCGCMVQQESVAAKIKQSFPFVDLVFGTHVVYRLPELLCRLLQGGKRVFERPDLAGVIAEGLPVRRDSAFKGWLPIMYGCNNFCTYCIVPYVRGRERSREPEDVLREAREMVAAGFKDITLLGQNVNSYGRGADHGVDFAGLLRRVNAIEGDFRIRFMTSHPRDCTLDLLDAMRDCEKVCGHLHLPFQSGATGCSRP
ncbi:MAG: MiaB/RimO family radical SAM methylthiotransferase, partial [Clostridia bacterium]|nr:MiaB/RimO family radical SAM methylthiotransferase [Clostridia bacterium]